MFMVLGSGAPLTKIITSTETQVEFIARAIKKMEENGDDSAIRDATKKAGKEWIELCESVAERNLFKVTDSWILGTNVRGRKKALRVYFGGMMNYRKELKPLIEEPLLT
ncbi:hypothetical protein EJ08DRAFT_665054 [Tothia fuscella]|uniref:Uncharacterized protein n=1 Tax=Tothia fuscella TaxID=1048955 RepID=A0A9P4NHL7_9PEZI|nr:hypothetical protein EJ08DRAFT_665054 [Tothia fuscella]